MIKLKKNLSCWLTQRYQLVIRNEENFSEKSTFRFNYAKLLSLLSMSFTILVGCSLLLAHTVLARWLNPVYLEQENKKKILQLSSAVDTLEEQISQQKEFIALLQSIIAGKETPTYQLLTVNQAQERTHAYTAEELEEADALLHSKFEESELPLASAYHQPMHDLQDLFLFTPITGMITTRFNAKHYGIDIVSRENEPIKCIADGVVMLSSWTVETGWVMAIQHPKHMVSIYKHSATLLRKVGDFVKSGDVIGIIGNSGELSTGPHLHFELWYEGRAVNPEHFITF